jgi:tetratricopeptide (TPR) repeat protein
MRLESLKDILSQFPDKDGLWASSDLIENEKLILSQIKYNETEKADLVSLEKMTQLARVYSLQEKFSESDKLLKTIKAQLNLYPELERKHVEIRYLLELGRLLTIQMNPSKAIPVVNETFELARKANYTFFAIDAALLLSLISPLKKQTEILQWALTEAEKNQNTDAHLWLPYLFVMKAWSLFDNKQFDTALSYFEKALKLPHAPYQKNYTLMIRWSIARVIRATGDFERAINLQYELKNELEAVNEVNGFILLEIAECLFLQQKEQESKSFFESAYLILSVNPWYIDNRETELERMKKIYKKRY